MRGQRAVLLSVLLIGVLFSERRVWGENNRAQDDYLSHLRSTWDVRRSEIHSAVIRFRTYFGVKPAKACNDKDLQDLIDRYQLTTSIDRLSEFLSELSGPTAKLVAPVRVHQQDGERTRQEFGGSLYIEDLDYFLVRHQKNRQIAAHFRGGSTVGIPRLDQIRRIPSKKVQPESVVSSAEGLRFVTKTQLLNQDRDTQVLTEYLCEEQSGLPTRIRHFLDDHLYSDFMQLNIATVDGEVPFPNCSLDISYDQTQVDPIVQEVTVYVVEDASFNRSIPDSTFVMSKPLGTEVFDRRFSSAEVALGVADQDVSDVRSILPTGPSAALAITVPAMSMRRRLFFFVNGVALLGLSAWLWRRAFRTNS
jgi:hypothetical protein